MKFVVKRAVCVAGSPKFEARLSFTGVVASWESFNFCDLQFSYFLSINSNNRCFSTYGIIESNKIVFSLEVNVTHPETKKGRGALEHEKRGNLSTF